PGAEPRVSVINGAVTGPADAFLFNQIVGDPADRGGVYVAAGDVDGDGRPDLVTGAGGGAPIVRVFSGASGVPLWTAEVYASTFTGGVRVAAGDVTGDGYADIITG